MCISYFIILIGEVLQVSSCIAPDGVQPVVEHGNDLWQLWLTPAAGAGTFPQSAVQWRHAPSFTLGQRCPSPPIVHVPWTAHIAIQGAFVAPVEGGRRTGVNVNIVFKDTLTFTIRDIADETIIIPLLNECWRKIIMCTSDTQQSQSWLCKHCTQNRQNSSLKYCMSQYKNVPSPAWGTMRKCMEVAGHSAVVHWVSQSIVGLIITHAALVILQTVRLCDKPRDGRQLQCTSHTHNLQRQAPK